jgi:putative acetyltransferase
VAGRDDPAVGHWREGVVVDERPTQGREEATTRVRVGLVTDAAQLAAFATRTFTEAFAKDNRPEDLEQYLASAYGVAQQARELADPQVVTLLAHEGSTLSAYAQVRRSGPPSCVGVLAPIELQRFYVDRPFQGRGVAGMLMGVVHDAVDAMGGRHVWLGVWERNARAIAFYRREGFVDVGSKDFYVGPDRQTDRVLVASVRDAGDAPWKLDARSRSRIKALARMQIRRDDLSGPEIRALLEEHLRNMHSLSPPESVHALDLDGLRRPEITFWTVWSDGALLGCGALKALDDRHAEIKSMRTATAHRRSGVAQAMLQHILAEATQRRYTRLSLETGSQPEFEPARRLYRKFGFDDCAPFADYTEDPNSVFMTRSLASDEKRVRGGGG